MNNTKPMVSIAMMTYFHEKYVSRAIESVLNQITTYEFEIVISDDCSKDATRDILENYKKKYPDIIKLNFNEKNLGISLNNYTTRCLCKGKYIATLSGDDYWIDPYKLQKQVDFLETNSNYDAVVTNVEARYDDDDKAFLISPSYSDRNRAISLSDFLKGSVICTHSLLMRNAYLTQEGRSYFSLVYRASPFVDDTTECILILRNSDVFSMDFNSAAYRVQRDKVGKTNYTSQNNVIKHTDKMVSLYNNVHKEFNDIDLFYMYKTNIAKALAYSLSVMSFSDFFRIYNNIPYVYRNRFLLLRSIPSMIKISIKVLKLKLRK